MTPEQKRKQLDNLAKARAARKAQPNDDAVRRQEAVARRDAMRREVEEEEAATQGDTPAAIVAQARAKRRDPTVQRGPTREAPAKRDIKRDPVTGRVMVMGRDGQMITRRITQHGDRFHIDKADIPEGWSYQWIAMEIMGAHQRQSLANFAAGGWEPVTMDRYPGRYGPKGSIEHIILDGLGLYERPKELTEEARGEEVDAARALIRTRNEQFVPKMPESRRRRGTQLQAKRSIEPMPQDIGRPVYQMDVDPGLVE